MCIIGVSLVAYSLDAMNSLDRRFGPGSGHFLYPEEYSANQLLFGIGTAIAVFSGVFCAVIVFYTKGEKKEKKEKLVEWRFNQLCILGAIIGLIALLPPWIWAVMGGSTSSASITYYMMRPPGGIGLQNGFEILLAILFSSQHLLSSLFMSMFLLYILGTIIAFISPIGGFIQIAGALLCIPTMPSELWFSWFVPFGELLGIYSGMIVVASMFKPMGAGYADRAMDIKERLLSFRRSSIRLPALSETISGEKSIAHSISTLRRRISISKKMLLVLLIPVFLILATSSYYVLAVPQPYYGGSYGPISVTNKISNESSWFWYINSIVDGPIFKSDVYVQLKNASGFVINGESLENASGTHGFKYVQAFSGNHLSSGDLFSLSRDYPQGCTITLITPFGIGKYCIMTV